MAVNNKGSRAGHNNTEKDALEAEARHHTSEEVNYSHAFSLSYD